MRIRKNAKLAGMVFTDDNSSTCSAYTTEPLLEPRDCQLNQSPWDVIAFSTIDSTTSSHRPHRPQLGGDNSLTGSGNVSMGDSVVAIESDDSMMKVDSVPNSSSDMVVDFMNDRKKKGKQVVDYNGQKGLGKGRESTGLNYCNKADGKGWQCKREAVEGSSLCEHHLSLHKSHSCSIGRKSYKLPQPPQPTSVAKGAIGRPRGRPRKKAATSNPYEFYYYSGFGPQWGKKRGGNSKVEQQPPNKSVEIESSDDMDEATPSSSPQIDHGNNYTYVDLDLLDDYDDEDDYDEDGERKRTRKPVKARSLKSLM